MSTTIERSVFDNICLEIKERNKSNLTPQELKLLSFSNSDVSQKFNTSNTPKTRKIVPLNSKDYEEIVNCKPMRI